MALVRVDELCKALIHALAVYPTIIARCKAILIGIVHKADDAPSVFSEDERFQLLL